MQNDEKLEDIDLSLDDELEESHELNLTDNFLFGFLLTLIIVVVMMALLYSSEITSYEDLGSILKEIYADPRFTGYMVGSIMPAMFIFFFFYKTDRFQSAKGLIVAVVLSMVLVILH